MKRSLKVILIGAILTGLPLVGAMNLEVLVREADAIVVARATDGVDLVDGLEFKLTVVRSLHGEPIPGQLLNVKMKLLRDRGVNPSKGVNGSCGLFTLKRTASGWEAPGYAKSPFFSSTHVPLGECESSAPSYPAGISVFERCLEEIALAASRDPGEGASPVRLYDFTAGVESPVVDRIMTEASRSEALPLRIEGLAWRVANGDADALAEIVQLAAGPAKAIPLRSLSLALFGYVSTSKAGVFSLGRIVVDPEFGNPYLKRSAAHALRNIHTRDAVPFLAEMLNSEDPKILAEAVSGLTEFVLGVRPTSDGPEKHAALDEALNPGRRKGAPLLAEQQHLHMGGFSGLAEQSRIVSHWRSWWETQKADFPSPSWE